MINKLFQSILFMIIGGSAYMGIEWLWRGYSHWSMGVLGGICFIIVGSMHILRLPLLGQAIAGCLMITLLELITGLILNVWLQWGIWDYSHLPYNLFGQICLRYAFLWLPLSLAAIPLYHELRCLLFRLERPKYRII
ncbi:membrane protein [Bacillus sp. FJAT-27916]|uniref:putative ABC transporter permease n=1 Tax=Bacillaceae TaxID=186817 RepID=UPI0006A0E519|nr:hypothetical protein [Bacillus sp. FJAT-27916]KMY45517.1 membrane protein [Bacillus sp. FJAT-27916]